MMTKRKAGLEALQELSLDIADLADLVADVAQAIDFSPEKAELFSVMLLDAVAEPMQDAMVDDFGAMGGGMPAPMGAPMPGEIAPAPVVPEAMPPDLGPDLGGGAPLDMPPDDLGGDIPPDAEILDVDESEVTY
jgi:hypothetical protein